MYGVCSTVERLLVFCDRRKDIAGGAVWKAIFRNDFFKCGIMGGITAILGCL